MKLSHYAISELVPLVTGAGYPPTRSGRELVKLFNQFGSRDLYDGKGLPDIHKPNGQRPSRKEYAEARLVALNDKETMRELLNQLLNEITNPAGALPPLNTLLQPEGYTVTVYEGQYFLQGGVIDKSTPVVNQAHFQDIQRQLLAVLDEARVSIRVIMAWFTNQALLEKLLEKSRQGVDVQLGIYDDGINRKHGVDLSQLPCRSIRRGLRGGLMHDKFCVVDNQIVVTGSYNWTNNAEFHNDENITVERDPAQATRYSEEYRRLTG